MMADLLQFPRVARRHDEAWANAWAGLVRMMEANGRAETRISLADARRVAEMARKMAQGGSHGEE
jgi:hypothetical protein